MGGMQPEMGGAPQPQQPPGVDLAGQERIPPEMMAAGTQPGMDMGGMPMEMWQGGAGGPEQMMSEVEGM